MTWALLLTALGCAIIADGLFRLADRSPIGPAEAYHIGVAGVGFWLLATVLLACAIVGAECSTWACNN